MQVRGNPSLSSPWNLCLYTEISVHIFCTLCAFPNHSSLVASLLYSTCSFMSCVTVCFNVEQSDFHVTQHNRRYCLSVRTSDSPFTCYSSEQNVSTTS